jgi:hypothetical protein
MRLAGSTAPGSGSGVFTGHFLSNALSAFVMLASATLSRCDRFGRISSPFVVV